MLWYIVIILIIIFGYLKLYKPHQYWKERNVTHRKPTPILGSLESFITQREHTCESMQKMYNEFPNERYIGTYAFLRPTLLLLDIDLIKQIFIKDFDHFIDRNVFLTEEEEPLFGKSLFFLKGQKWRDMRSTLSPAFTGSKMRLMVPLISECGETMANYFIKNAEPNKPMTIDVKDVCTRYSTDVIASCAFGIKTDSLQDRNNEFYNMGLEASFTKQSKLFKFLGYMLSKSLMKFFNIKIFSEEESNYFRKLVSSVFEMREKEGVIRNDMIQLLMEAKKGNLKYEENSKISDTGFATVEESSMGKEKKKSNVEFDDDDYIAQAILFFAAGFDTTATVLSFLCCELAINEEIQRKLQQEIDEVFGECNGKLTYESIMKMKYLDMVICETLRKWPPISGYERLCIKPYTIDAVKPGENSVHIETGMNVWIVSYSMHRDPKYFPDPDRFDPERFSDENKKNIVPFSYVPFGVGPRNCIGSRFALLESKVFIIHLLAKFDVVVTEKTTVPLKLDRKSFGMNIVNGFWVGLKLRNNINH